MPTIVCPECDRPIPIREDQAGKKMRCSKCQHVFRIPAADERTVDVDVVEEVDDEPVRKKSKSYVPCPKCSARNPRRVKWTPWGSFYGPALLCHVCCQECGYKYNGRSGRSNLIPAILFMSIPLLIIAGIAWWVVKILQARGQL